MDGTNYLPVVSAAHSWATILYDSALHVQKLQTGIGPKTVHLQGSLVAVAFHG